jgi:hypothetical protein
MQELDDFVSARTDLLDVHRLPDGVEIVPHVMDATAGGRDDVVEAGKVAHE